MAIEYKFQCHNKWDALDDHPSGKFCHTCHKIVYDFSSMTDEEILLYLKKRGERVCIMQNGTGNTSNKQHLIPFYKLVIGILSILGIGCENHRTLGEPSLPISCQQETDNQNSDTLSNFTLGEPVIVEENGED